MIYILTIVLASGIWAPVEMAKAPCELAVQMLAAGQPIYVELEDGSKHQVIAAECTQKGVES